MNVKGVVLIFDRFYFYLGVLYCSMQSDIYAQMRAPSTACNLFVVCAFFPFGGLCSFDSIACFVCVCVRLCVCGLGRSPSLMKVA